jgi:hypothetical protein
MTVKSRRLRIAITLTGNVMPFILMWLMPLLASYIIRPIEPGDTWDYFTPFVGGGDDIEPIFLEENPMVSVALPKVLHESETGQVSVGLEERLPSIALLQGRQYSTLSYTVTLTSPAFDITPSTSPIQKSGERRLQWEWLIYPKKSGNHKVIVEFSQEVISPRSIEWVQKHQETASHLKLSPNSVVAKVTVLTSLGLTAFQHSLFTAIGATIACIGALLGYPLWKRFLEEGTWRKSKTDSKRGKRKKSAKKR